MNTASDYFVPPRGTIRLNHIKEIAMTSESPIPTNIDNSLSGQDTGGERATSLLAAQDLDDAFHALGRKFMDVNNRLWQLEALFDVMTEMDCLVNAKTDEVANVYRLADMGRDVARLGDTEANEFTDLLEDIRQREVVARQLPPEELVRVLQIVAAGGTVQDSERMWELTELCDALFQHHRQGGLSFDAFLAMRDYLTRKGAYVFFSNVRRDNSYNVCANWFVDGRLVEQCDTSPEGRARRVEEPTKEAAHV